MVKDKFTLENERRTALKIIEKGFHKAFERFVDGSGDFYDNIEYMIIDLFRELPEEYQKSISEHVTTTYKANRRAK